MKWFANLRTALKLAIGFGVVLTLMVIISVVSIQGLSSTTKSIDKLKADGVDGGQHHKVGWHRVDALPHETLSCLFIDG